MKKFKTIYISVLVVGMIIFNLTIIVSKADNYGCINLSSLKQAFAEGEGGTITCDGGGQGVCYVGIEGQLVMCGETTAWTIECHANGDPNSTCTPYNPCS